MSKIGLWITSKAWLVLLIGVGMLGLAGWNAWKAAGDHAVAAQQDLTTITGKVVQAGVMTVEHKRRRGGSWTERYYRLDVAPAAGGEVVKLRLPMSVSEDTVREFVDAKIDARYDATDGNEIYIGAADGKALISYEATKARRVAAAKARSDADGGGLVGGGFLLLIGGALGLWWRKRLLAAQDEEMPPQAAA
jgi:hypothetical protein